MNPVDAFQTTDLMKKGLRVVFHLIFLRYSLSDHRPDEEGIKRGTITRIRLRLQFQTTDLMKKGLRDKANASMRPRPGFRPQT